jgi:hypothetical protein
LLQAYALLLPLSGKGIAPKKNLAANLADYTTKFALGNNYCHIAN